MTHVRLADSNKCNLIFVILKDDPEAHNKFVLINRAYEVLKDEDLRKKYDRFGEEGLKEQKQQWNRYESWQFYKTEFGKM